MKRRPSLLVELNIFVILVILVIVVTGCTVAISIFTNIYERDVTETVTHGIQAFRQNVLTENERRLQAYAVNLATAAARFDSGQDDAASSLFNVMLSNSLVNLSFVTVTKDEHTVAQYVKCGPEIMSIAQRYNGAGQQEIRTWVDGNGTEGLYAFTSVPIRSGGKSVGWVLAGTKLSSEENITLYRSAMNLDASIFAENVRVVTTVRVDGISPVGQTMSPEVNDAVIGKGREFFGKTTVAGQPFITAYSPILNREGKIVGAIFLGKSMSAIFLIKKSIIVSITILGALMLSFLFVFSHKWITKYIARPINKMIKAMDDVAKGHYGIEQLTHSESKEIASLHTSLEAMVKEISAKNNKLEIVAYYDPLTGLMNRAYLYSKYENIPLVRNIHTLTTLFYLDIDNLKYINNLYSHRVGDLLLTQIGVLLAEIIAGNRGYQVFRIAGDEFVVCREGPYEESDVRAFAEQLVDVFDRSFDIDGIKVDATASVGISFSNYCDGCKCEECTGKCKKNLDTLLKEAEISMYEVKNAGKNNYQLFDPQMSEKLENKAAIQQELRNALKNGEFTLHYQPQFSIADNKFNGFEALVRWNHPEKGLIPPAVFIPIAEESTMIIDIGEYVLREACAFITKFNARMNTVYTIAINVSTMQLLSDHFLELIDDVLRQTGLPPQLLELEITESLFIQATDVAIERLTHLRELGIGVALDDFGTGYSSLTYLRLLPLTTLKIDKSFVDDIARDEQAMNLIDNIIKIAKVIGLKIVAEGVETLGQLEIVRKLHCDIIQGYYFSKPLPENEIYNLLNQS